MTVLDTLLADLKTLLSASTAGSRAHLLDELTRAIYEHVKANVTVGARAGFDNAGTPEREALGVVRDLVRQYVDELELLEKGVRPVDSAGQDSRIAQLAHEVYQVNNY